MKSGLSSTDSEVQVTECCRSLDNICVKVWFESTGEVCINGVSILNEVAGR